MKHYFENSSAVGECDFPIDLVYAWVDGADSKWQQRKNEWLKKTTGLVPDAVQGRFDNHDELKYSLRSVAKFAPWIRHIYIVTDQQVPDFLKLDHPGISVVEHSEIYEDQTLLPVFNSESIEWRLPFIPGLSEHFIYGNDDFFLMRHTSPSFFFQNGDPVVRVWPHTILAGNWYDDTVYQKRYAENSNAPWIQWMLKINKLVLDHYGRAYGNVPYHGFDPYRKSNFLKVMEEPFLHEAIARTVASRFRTGEDLDRHIVALIDNVCGRNRLIMRRPFERYLKFLRFSYEFQIIDNEKNMDRLLYWLRPYQFCVYDGLHCTDSYLKRLPRFLTELFPEKGPFEK